VRPNVLLDTLQVVSETIIASDLLAGVKHWAFSTNHQQN